MAAMAQEADVIWSGRPWIGPSLVLRTILTLVAGILVLVILSSLSVLTSLLFAVPLYVWVLGILAIAWLASLAGLMVMRASSRYVLRRGSIEVDRGIARKKSLIVSPSGFSELEVDQGIMGRLLNYGSLEVRSQGGQELKLRLIRDPKGVSARIRDIMTTPTVRIAKDEPPSTVLSDERK
jgi:uncharacterized membrane protein YdbT with pleckstrin-like domain